ncbi:NUDIX hydrolase [Sandarakinorhabdus sp. DWP1-3-1]|uniref:NUDIX hydrolase n=1 Tax=Sandarakinorhabdus sp. DWP1-3-1 TaxID=2804627 RepID=UPI003CFA8F82
MTALDFTAVLAVIPMSIVDGVVAVLLSKTGGDAAALPTGSLGAGETLEAAARRILSAEAPVAFAYLEQLYSFATPATGSGPTAITIAYVALVPGDGFAVPLQAGDRLALAEVIVPWAGETGGPVDVCTPGGEPLALPPGDADILGQAMLRLRGKLDYSGVGFALLPERFTLRQLQDVHEAILGVRLNKPAFRRRMLDKGWLAATGDRETGASFRPAELYRYLARKGA